MSSSNLNKFMTLILFSGLGVYSGVRFFEPLVVEQLKKDGNLRTDIEIPEFDENGDKIVNGVKPSEKWAEFKQKLEAPADEKKNYELNFSPSSSEHTEEEKK